MAIGNKKSYYSLKEIKLQDQVRVDDRVLCKNCGHSLLIPKVKGKKLCSHCGRYVFLDSKEEFLYRMKEVMR
jgi:hypothetical protein